MKIYSFGLVIIYLPKEDSVLRSKSFSINSTLSTKKQLIGNHLSNPLQQKVGSYFRLILIPIKIWYSASCCIMSPITSWWVYNIPTYIYKIMYICLLSTHIINYLIGSSFFIHWRHWSWLHNVFHTHHCVSGSNILCNILVDKSEDLYKHLLWFYSISYGHNVFNVPCHFYWLRKN